jgi:hypothetical protein
MSVIYQNKTYRAKRKKGHLSLDLSGKKITHVSSIEGLEDLHDLEVLDLSNNSISEIEGLEALRNLNVLNLANNSITEIKNLENLTNLVWLNLNKNPIHTLKGLDTLAKLRLLNLYNCKIGEIESLENKQWLQGIALGKNPIYSDLYKIIKKKKKLRKMTEEQRKQKNIDPKLWYIADNTHFKLIYRKEQASDQKAISSAISSMKTIRLGYVVRDQQEFRVQRKYTFIKLFSVFTTIGLALIAFGSFWIFNVLVNPGRVCDYSGCRPKYPDEIMLDLADPILLIIFGTLSLSLSVVLLVKKEL